MFRETLDVKILDRNQGRSRQSYMRSSMMTETSFFELWFSLNSVCVECSTILSTYNDSRIKPKPLDLSTSWISLPRGLRRILECWAQRIASVPQYLNVFLTIAQSLILSGSILAHFLQCRGWEEFSWQTSTVYYPPRALFCSARNSTRRWIAPLRKYCRACESSFSFVTFLTVSTNPISVSSSE